MSLHFILQCSKLRTKMEYISAIHLSPRIKMYKTRILILPYTVLGHGCLFLRVAAEIKRVILRPSCGGCLFFTNQRSVTRVPGLRPFDLAFVKQKLTSWLMEPGGSMLHSQGLSNNSYLSRINPIPRIDTNFKVHSNIVLPFWLHALSISIF